NDPTHSSYFAELSGIEIETDAMLKGDFNILLPSFGNDSNFRNIATFLEDLRLFLLSRENTKERLMYLLEKWEDILAKIKNGECEILNRHALALGFLGLKLLVNIMPLVFHPEEAKKRMEKYETWVKWLVELFSKIIKEGHEGQDIIVMFSSIALSAVTQYLRYYGQFESDVPSVVLSFDPEALSKIFSLNDNFYFFVRLSLLSAIGNTIASVASDNEPILGDIANSMINTLKMELPHLNPVHIWAFMPELMDFGRKGRKLNDIISFIESIEHATPPLVTKIIREVKKEIIR
ncbi:MAG: hypothetical protein QXL15_04705, partial [Candidatus Korarchaeota archaeon]